MAASVPRCTGAVPVGASLAAVGGVSRDAMSTPPVATAATSTVPAARSHVLRFTASVPVGRDAGRLGVVAAFLPGGVESVQATGRVGRRDPVRVDQGTVRAGVREVVDAVVAHALGELQGRLLLRRAPLVAGEPGRLQL